MKVKGDKFRRSYCYTVAAVENDRASEEMAKRYTGLADLIKDEMTAEVFQDTFCRITVRYKGGDFVKMFKRLFYNTLKEQIKLTKTYNNITQPYADDQ